ncbi:MAG: YceI family protein [Cyclobacteriaceae bacterium]
MITLLQIGRCSAQIRTFRIDSEGSNLSFSVTHLGFLTVDGVFSEFSGSCITEGNDLQSVEGTVRVGSIDTNDESRDEALKSEAYLDEDSYPFISFASTDIGNGANSSILTGVLKLKDVEKEIRIPFEFGLTENNRQCLLKVSTSIKRSDFNLDFGAMDALVGDEVKVEMEVVATLD